MIKKKLLSLGFSHDFVAEVMIAVGEKGNSDDLEERDKKQGFYSESENLSEIIFKMRKD